MPKNPLQTLDWIVIGGYFVMLLAIALYYRRFAGRSLDEFFLGGRRNSGWSNGLAYAAALMNVAPPPETPFETAELSPMARSFYGENKRVSNAAIKASGYDFQFPDYRSAFDRMWVTGAWKGVGESDARSPMRKD